MGWQDRAETAIPNVRGSKLTEGSYVVHVHEAKEYKGKPKGTVPGKIFCIVSGKILESTVANFPPGTEMSYAIPMDSEFESYANESAADARAFCAAVVGIEPGDTAKVVAEVNRSVIDAIFSPEGGRNAARGSVLALRVMPKPKGAKAQAADAALIAAGQGALVKPPFMRHEWRPMLENGAPAFRALPPLTKVAAVAAPVAATPAFGNGGWQNAASAAVVPQLPTLPQAAPALPSLPAAFPPPGWKAHDQDPSYFYNVAQGASSPILKEAELRVAMSQGKA